MTSLMRSIVRTISLLVCGGGHKTRVRGGPASRSPPLTPSRRLLEASPHLIHAVGHGADDGLVAEVLVEALQVHLPVDAVVLGWGLRGRGGPQDSFGGWELRMGTEECPRAEVTLDEAAAPVCCSVWGLQPLPLLPRSLPHPPSASWPWARPPPLPRTTACASPALPEKKKRQRGG